MKRILSIALCFCLLAPGFGAVLSYASGENLLSGKVVWTASSFVTLTAGDNYANRLENLTDGNAGSYLASNNLNAATAFRLFFDLGAGAPSYNRLKVSFASYNAMKISAYTSATVHGSLSPYPATNPPAATGTSSVRFLNYDNPIATVNFNPYYISTAGASYPQTQTLSFNTKSDRYLCVEITTAYSAASGDYAGINNIISGIELGYGAPARIEVSSSADSVAIPSAQAPDKTVSFTADIFDADGERVTDSALAGRVFSLASAYPGVSIDPATGVVTVTKAAVPSDITVAATCTTEGYTAVTGSKTISLAPVDTTEKELAEAVTALEFSLLSPQKITAVGSSLSLLQAANGSLRIGSKSYSGMDISWSSSNTSVISTTGVVTRPAGANANVILTATLSKQNSENETLTAAKAFQITVIKAGEPVDMINIMKGSYGWVASGWGQGSIASAVDGNPSTTWTVGNHSLGSITGGFKTKSGVAEKYNKVVLTLNTIVTEGRMVSCVVTGYKTNPSDPGVNGNKATSFAAGTGAVPVMAYAVSPDDPKIVTLVENLPEPAVSTYFGITVTVGAPMNQNDCGVYEFEVYYAAPYDVRMAEPDTILYIPGREGTISYDIPELIVYDELGDVLEIPFENSISLAGSYNGVTLENGKIKTAYGCTESSVDLLYRSWDEDRVWLEKTITIPLEVYTQDYYDAVVAREHLESVIPEKLEESMTLPTQYNGAAIAWSSNKAGYLSTEGVVNRPTGSADEAVVLTALITKGSYKITRPFHIVVIRDMTDQQRVVLDADHINLGISGTVSANITLPSVGYYGSGITWSSDKPEAISAAGVYHRISASKSSLPVILTARVTYNGKTVTKDFTVYAAANVQESGGGGGGSPSGKGVSLVPGAEAVPPMTELTGEELARGKFLDVPAQHWAKEYIEKLAAKRIVSGTSDTRFEPNRTVTREEFIKMIITAFGYTLKPGGTEFADVTSGMWYEDYVVTAYKEGIVNGVSGTEFGIGRSITREDMAVIMERVLARRNVDFIGSAKSFSDAEEISEYALSAVGNLTMIGVLSGDDAGNFAPRQNATRAEAAKVLLTAMEKGGIKQ